jgi:glycosyltransferase involved in cell wall biosynthesis
MQEISVVIISKDEERTIGRVLDSVRSIASEIVLVDSGSKDRTVEIAGSFGARTYHQDWLGYAAQKNYALALASKNWILSLDADEVVSPELAVEIKDVLARSDAASFDGFRLPRILYIGDHAIAHGGFYPDAQLRLFQRGKGEFHPRKVHEAVKVKGRVGSCKNPLIHYAYPDFTAYAAQMNKYALLSAEEFAENGYSAWKTSRLNEWLHPAWTFFYRFFCRAGFLDGAYGLKANWIYRDYVRKKIVYLRELEQRTP